LRINSTINSFFMTCHAGIGDTKLEGYEEKFTHKKIYVALQATLEGTWLQYHAQLKTTAPLRGKQVTKLTNEVAEMRSGNEKVIEDFKSSKEIEVLRLAYSYEGFQCCMKPMKKCYPTIHWMI
ncbi:unnamed protein product, partial [Prunus brigantina]